MTRPEKLLIIENELTTARALRNHLCLHFAAVSVSFDGASALKDLSSQRIDAIILDGDTLPDTGGIALLREIRRLSPLPVVYLSASGASFEKIRVLDAGADDYLQKPVDMRELTARINAIWRRYMTVPPKASVRQPSKRVAYENLEINLTNYTVVCGGERVDMPPKELELFYFLASSPNQVFTREQLLNQIWGYDYMGDPRTVDVHIKRIRERIKKDHETWSLDTVWGVGYKFTLRSTYISSDGPFAPSAQTDSAAAPRRE